MRRHGYASASRPASFLVEGIEGPLCTGEVERAVGWGRELGGLCRLHTAAVRAHGRA